MGDNTECKVVVTYDVLPGVVDFVKPSVNAKQTDKEIVVALKRTQYTQGTFE